MDEQVWVLPGHSKANPRLLTTEGVHLMAARMGEVATVDRNYHSRTELSGRQTVMRVGPYILVQKYRAHTL